MTVSTRRFGKIKMLYNGADEKNQTNISKELGFHGDKSVSRFGTDVHNHLIAGEYKGLEDGQVTTRRLSWVLREKRK